METYKEGTMFCYLGYKAYQHLTMYWAEQAMVVISEFASVVYYKYLYNSVIKRPRWIPPSLAAGRKARFAEGETVVCKGK